MTDKPIGRLALRDEGSVWVAYYAMPGTMKGAFAIASIAMKFVDNPERKAAFMELMQECVADILEETTGVRPTWPDGPVPAPESERGGHG